MSRFFRIVYFVFILLFHQFVQYIFAFSSKRKGTLEPGQYYLQPDGILKALPPGQTAPRGTQVVSVRSNNPQQQNQLSQSKHVSKKSYSPVCIPLFMLRFLGCAVNLNTLQRINTCTMKLLLLIFSHDQLLQLQRR